MVKAPANVPLDVLFRALADPTRLRILNLIGNREICVCYFVEILGLSQPKISRHLAYCAGPASSPRGATGNGCITGSRCPETRWLPAFCGKP